MRLIILLFTLCLTSSIRAQQNSIFSTEGFMPFVNNPASFGAWNGISVQSVGRTQWQGLVGNPRALAITAESAMRFIVNKEQRQGAPETEYRFGVGLNAVFDDVAGLRTQSFTVPLNYQFKIVNTHLSIGLAPGFLRYNWPAWGSRETKFDMSAGAMLYNENFYAGISASHLFAPTLLNIQRPQYLSVQGAYKFRVGEGKIIPMLQVGYTDGFWGSQIMGYYEFRDQLFTVGAGFRPNSSFVFTANVQYFGIRVGYAIDYYFNQFTSVSPFGHELRLAWIIPTPED